MKQERLFLIIGIIVFFTLLYSGPACCEGDNQAVADATLTAYELDAAPADQPLVTLPRWRSSLGDIQRAAATLLETNSKLNDEARQLKKDTDAMQAQVDAQRGKNAQISDDLERWRGKVEEDNDADRISSLKEVLADRNQQVRAQKEALASFKARRSSADSRLALLRLRVAGLEIDKKTMEVDAKSRDEAALVAARAQVQSVRDKIVKARRQIGLLDQKTAELNAVDNPYISEARKLVTKNAEMKERLTGIQERINAQQTRFEQVATSKFKMEKDRDVLRVQRLLNDRDVLQAQLKENAEKLEALKNDPVSRVSPVSELDGADIDTLQKQNAVMEELVGNLRENVALLEYKITTLQRYKDRSKPVARK